MKVTVLGCGSWGMALSLVLHHNGHEVTAWAHTVASCYILQRTRCNEKLLPTVYLPAGIRITNDFQSIPQADVIVFAVPSFAVVETAKQITKYLKKSTVVINVAKGLDAKNNNQRFSQTLKSIFGEDQPIVALTGPTHAEEVADCMPTAILAASADLNAAEICQDAFMNDCFRVYTSSDIIGAEIGGALKNVIALGVGISDGMGLGDNSKAAFMTRGLTEIARLGVKLGARQDTFAGLSGIGDLIVTCISNHSRNRRAGLAIGKGGDVSTVLKSSGGVVEGYYATGACYALAKDLQVSMPIIEAMYRVLYDDADRLAEITGLMTRARKHETEELWIQG